jgi:pimeloyl-ACP methyl ester carboxylesterase
LNDGLSVVAGGRDRLIPPEMVRATASGIPDARLVLLLGRGHATALFDLRMKSAIAAFLAESDPMKASRPSEPVGPDPAG